MGWRRKLGADELYELGVSLSQTGDLAAAEQKFDSALRRYRAGEQGYEARNGIARTRWRLSLVKSTKVSRLGDAVDDGRAAVRLWDELLAGEGVGDLTLIRELARCCTDLAMMELTAARTISAVPAAGKFSESGLKHAERAVELTEILVREGHPEGRTEFGTAQHNLAVAYQKTGSPAKGAEAAAKAVKVRQQLSEASSHPSLADWECANSLLLSGVLYLDSGQPKFAATALVRAAELAATLGVAGHALTSQVVREMARLHEQHPGILKGREIHIRPRGMW